MRSLLRRLGVLTTSTACLLAVASGPAVAAPTPSPTPQSSTSYSRQDSDFGLLVSPARLVVGPEDAGRPQQVTVVNRGQAPLDLQVQLRNFTQATDGSLAFDQNAPYAAADWVEVSPSRFVLAPGTSRQVTASVTVPDDPEPGDHQVAVVFLVPSTGGEGNVRINRGIAAPVFVTGPGTTDDSVQLPSLDGPRLAWRGRVDLTATLQSTGNTHRDFRGPTALAAVDGTRSTRFSDFTVVRGALRQVSTAWDAPLVCVCRPTLRVQNGDEPVQTASVRVVVLPWWLAAGALVVILAVLLLGVRSRRRPDPVSVVGDG